MQDTLMRVLEKLGTVAADRRFWIALITVAAFLANGVPLPDEEVAEWADAIIVVVAMVFTIIGWSIRAPSGIKRDNEQVVVVKLDEINTLPNDIKQFIAEQLKQHSLDV